MTMNEAIEKLMTAIKDDYRAHTWTDWMIERFEDGLTFKEGKKYIKILDRGSAWGFIVKGEDKQFKVGDILKPVQVGQHLLVTLLVVTSLKTIPFSGLVHCT